MRILDVINKTTPYFEKHGVDSPRLTIELLLAHVLQKKRLELYLEFERELDDRTLTTLRALVKRRADGEPLQYITGLAEFCGLEFAVDRRVLIPRPETELLVETVVNRLPPETPARIVDVGTGSGCIAVTLAKNRPSATIVALDRSADALCVAQANARRHGVEKNIGFFRGDLLEAVSGSWRADVIVSNPPYVGSGEIVNLPKEVRDFEPVGALAAGEDGLKVIRRLVMTAGRSLLPSGFLALEIGAGQRLAVETLLTENQFADVQVVRDLQGHERVLVAQPKNSPA